VERRKQVVPHRQVVRLQREERVRLLHLQQGRRRLGLLQRERLQPVELLRWERGHLRQWLELLLRPELRLLPLPLPSSIKDNTKVMKHVRLSSICSSCRHSPTLRNAKNKKIEIILEKRNLKQQSLPLIDQSKRVET
jgi:hypothetical protein